MRPSTWQPPVETSAAEDQILKRVKRAKLFVFLRRHRHQIFTPEFQLELAGIYQDSPKGFPPVEPAILALALILQAYTGVSDDEVIEATLMDRRLQLALNCLDAQAPPFSKSTLIAFRTRLIEHQMDRRLLERTVEIAAASEAFGPRNLRAALDSYAEEKLLQELHVRQATRGTRQVARASWSRTRFVAHRALARRPRPIPRGAQKLARFETMRCCEQSAYLCTAAREPGSDRLNTRPVL